MDTPKLQAQKAEWRLWLVWALVGIAVLLDLGALVLIALTPMVSAGFAWGFRGFAIVVSIPCIALGVLILHLHPRHAVGWFLLCGGLGGAIQAFVMEYVLRALFIAPGSLPEAILAAWVLNWIYVPITLTLALMLFYFPDGKLFSARWWSVVLFAFAVLVLLGGTLMFSPGAMTSSIGNVQNPYGIAEFAHIFDVTQILGYIGWISVMVLGAISLLLRFRRSRGVERQQIKWILSAAALLALVSPAAISDNLWLQSLIIVGFVFVLSAIGIAILRYRLYDIDILIRRTVVYALVTGLLAIVFFSSVVILEQIFARFTDSGQNEIVTVLATLAIAALFVPLRNRIQIEIDKRFNRKKYDAQQVLNDFANTVRDETDLEKLSARLMKVVDETMQPKSVTMWLKRTDKIGSRSKG